MSGRFILVAGPSGCGKSTLIQKAKHYFDDLVFPVSATTRPARVGEVNGIHYHFLSQEEFATKEQNGAFLESARVFDHYYGTLKDKILLGLEAGTHFIKDVDVQGAEMLMTRLSKHHIDSIFIQPPSLDRLRRQLESRKTDSPEVIEKRLHEAQQEMSKHILFDHCLLNDDLDVCWQQFRELILSILRHQS